MFRCPMSNILLNSNNVNLIDMICGRFTLDEIPGY